MLELLSGTYPWFDGNCEEDVTQQVRLGINAADADVDPLGLDLVHGVCHKDQLERFTHREIKEHPFFSNFSWTDFEDGTMQSPIGNLNKEKLELESQVELQADATPRRIQCQRHVHRPKYRKSLMVTA